MPIAQAKLKIGLSLVLHCAECSLCVLGLSRPMFQKYNLQPLAEELSPVHPLPPRYSMLEALTVIITVVSPGFRNREAECHLVSEKRYLVRRNPQKILIFSKFRGPLPCGSCGNLTYATESLCHQE